jgi:hypothetical protein
MAKSCKICFCHVSVKLSNKSITQIPIIHLAGAGALVFVYALTMAAEISSPQPGTRFPLRALV